MKLHGWDIFQFSVPLRRPIAARRQQVSCRSGLLVRLKESRGYTAWGEVAPLPGVHREHPQKLLPLLKQALHRLAASSLPESTAELAVQLKPLWEELKLPSILRYGLEMALLSLLAQVNGTRPACLFVEHPLPRLPLNGVLFGNGEDVLQRAGELAAQGYRAVKLKIGRRGLETDVALVRNLRRVLGEAMALRLDANRAWTLAQALAFARGVEEACPEYIEEPLQDPALLPDLIARTELPVALDESLAESSARQCHGPAARAWIIKPSVLGGLFEARTWVQMAARQGCVAVISAAFDTGLGLAALGEFAAAHMEPTVAAGLATHEFLAEDVLSSPFPLQKGYLQVDELDWRGRTVRLEALTPLVSV